MNDATTNSLRIVVATPDDVRGMQEVFYRGWLATYPNAEHGITVDDVEDRYKDRYSEEKLAQRREQAAKPLEGQTTLVAKLGEQVVGLCRVSKHPDRNQLYAIYLLPEYQGRGIGTAMWKAAQQYLDKNKHTIVEVATYNANAIKFYQGLGFVDTGKRMADPKFKMKSGAIIPEMEMRKEADMNEATYELVQANSPEEWEALHDLRRSELFARMNGIVYNTNHPDDHAPDHFPLVLKLNGKGIGTARLDLFENGEGAIRLVAIAKEEQRKGHGRVLEQKFEELARSKGVSKLFVNANKTAVGYYEQLGFAHEDWNDPAGARTGIAKDCVPMTKTI